MSNNKHSKQKISISLVTNIMYFILTLLPSSTQHDSWIKSCSYKWTKEHADPYEYISHSSSYTFNRTSFLKTNMYQTFWNQIITLPIISLHGIMQCRGISLRAVFKPGQECVGCMCIKGCKYAYNILFSGSLMMH